MRLLPLLLTLALFMARSARADDVQQDAGTPPPPPRPSAPPEAMMPSRPPAPPEAATPPRPPAPPDAARSPGATNRLAPPPSAPGAIAVQSAPDDRVYYGLILAPFDIVSAALVVGGLATGQSQSNFEAALLTTGIATYALGPPVVHLVRGNPGKGAIDLAIRVGAPLATAALGAALGAGVASGQCDQNNTCTIETIGYGALGGLAVGYISALMVDYLVLANDPAGPVVGHRVARAAAWSPYATPVPSGGSIGVVGVF